MSAPVTAGDRRFTFRLSRDDVAAWERLPRDADGRAKFQLLLPLIAVGMTFGIFADTLNHWQTGLDATAHQLVVGLAIAAIWYGIVTIIVTVTTNRRIARVPLADSDTIVDVDSDGVKSRGNGVERVYPWTRFLAVTRTPTHLFLPVDRDEVVILPLRAFASPDDMDAFARFADRSIRRDDAIN